MRQGLQGEALIVAATADRQKGRIGGIFGWNVTIRVKFDDNGNADFKRYVDASVLSFDGNGPERDLAAGTVVPIRFDPAKRSRVEIDTAALRSQQAGLQSQQSAQANATQDAAVLEAERNLKPITSQQPPSSD